MASGALRFLHLNQITERLGGESCVGRERRWEPGISMSPTNLRLRHRARFHMYQLVEHALQIVAICPNKVDPRVMFNDNKIVTAVDPYWAAGRRTPRPRAHSSWPARPVDRFTKFYFDQLMHTGRVDLRLVFDVDTPRAAASVSVTIGGGSRVPSWT